MSLDQIIFLIAFFVAVVKIECALQKMNLHTWPPRWLADLILLFAGAGGVIEIIIKNWRPGWVVTSLLLGATALLLFERRQPHICKIAK